MAPRFQVPALISLPVALALAVGAAAFAPGQAVAHQLTTISGAVVPHNHVYRRSSYGNGYQVGHVAPTPHGHDMIIWSPAPSNAYGSSVPQMQIVKPRRQLHPRSGPNTADQVKSLRELDPRNPRR